MTTLKYMEDQTLLKDTAKVVRFFNENGKDILVVDSTIFYPQGGGSPYDTGKIYSAEVAMNILEVRFIEGEVHHIGNAQGSFKTGDVVTLEVDRERRDKIAKLQSAGHLVDMALREAGREDLVPNKGFHFLEGSYVEYIGNVEESDRESLKIKLQEIVDQMVESGYEVKIQSASKDEATKLCYFVPPHLPENKPIRIVSVWNDEYMPCGGIHVQNISELKGLKIEKVKCKSGNTKISYSL